MKLRRAPEYFTRAPWRARREEARGGVLMIQAIHALDLLLWTLGMPRWVLGWTATAVHAVEVEDVAAAILQFPGGAVATLDATTAAFPENPPELEIHGEWGTAALFDSRGFLSFWASTLDCPGSLPDRWRHHAAEFREQEASAPSQAAIQPHAENIRDFVAAVREGRPPLVAGAEAQKTLVVIEAVYRSAQLRQWVDVTDSTPERIT